MASISWTGGNGNWTSGADWSTGALPGPGDDATIANGGSVTITSSIDVNSITVSGTSSNFSTLDIEAPGGTVTVSGNLTAALGVIVDHTSGGGGSTVNIGGTLGPDGFFIGNTALNAATTVTAAAYSGLLSGYLEGNVTNSTPIRATLYLQQAAPTIFGATPAVLSIEGDALLEFALGGINGIGLHGQLYMQGAQARVAIAADPGSNSALVGLNSNAGTFRLDDHAYLATTAGLDFTNSGVLEADNGAGVVLGGALTNVGIVTVDTYGDHGNFATTVQRPSARKLIPVAVQSSSAVIRQAPTKQFLISPMDRRLLH